MALDFTLLTEDQIRGDENGNGQLDVMKKYGRAVAPTDLAVVLGCEVIPDRKTSEGDSVCFCWTPTPVDSDDRIFVRVSDCHCFANTRERDGSVRPVLPASTTVDLIPDRRKTGVNNVDIVEYGEYPQTVVDEATHRELEDAFGGNLWGRFMLLFKEKKIKPTGKNYIFDATHPSIVTEEFQPVTCPEYEYKGKRYIRVPGRPHDNDSRLSTGEQVQEGEPYWVEVQPIEWLVDTTGAWVSKKGLISGLQFVSYPSGYNHNFQETFLKKYLDTFFAKEIGHEKRLTKTEHKKQEEQKKQKHDNVLADLSEQLERSINDEAVKSIEERLKLAEKDKKVQTTPERLHEAARIKRLRNARDILLKAHTEAQEMGDGELADSIVDMARPYAARYAVQQNKVHCRRAKRRQSGR